MSPSSFDRANAQAATSEARAGVAMVARWWWVLLISAALWLIVGIILLQLNVSSVVTVGYLIGFMLIFTGIEQFAVAGAVSGGWRWVWVLFGVFFLAGGIWTVVNPIGGAAALASSLGLLFVLIAIFWLVEAITTRATNVFWLLTLLSSLIMLGMGIWVASQGLLSRAITLLVFAGIWAIIHGVGDAVRAFELRKVGKLVTDGH